jgi:Fe2+ or Zn2+ uptake regulation protein
MEDYDATPEVEGYLQAALEALAAGNGFRATSHRLELRGLCTRCSS